MCMAVGDINQHLALCVCAGAQHAAVCDRRQEQSQGLSLEVLADCLPQERL